MVAGSSESLGRASMRGNIRRPSFVQQSVGRLQRQDGGIIDYQYMVCDKLIRHSAMKYVPYIEYSKRKTSAVEIRP